MTTVPRSAHSPDSSVMKKTPGSDCSPSEKIRANAERGSVLPVNVATLASSPMTSAAS